MSNVRVFLQPMSDIPHNERVLLVMSDNEMVVALADWRESKHGVERRLLICGLGDNGPFKTQAEWTELVGSVGDSSRFKGFIALPDCMKQGWKE